jgi:hypothetical protein
MFIVYFSLIYYQALQRKVILLSKLLFQCRKLCGQAKTVVLTVSVKVPEIQPPAGRISLLNYQTVPV